MEYFLENGRLKAKVRGLGAELSSLFHKEKGKELLWTGDPSIWAGQSPLLFPVVGKVKNDCYRLGHSEYPMPKHGFALKSEFSPVASGPSSLTLALSDSAETRACYPYAFRLEVCFQLADNRLEVTHTVHNPDPEKELLFSIGAHPGFQCELGDRLCFEKEESGLGYRFHGDLLLNPVPVPVPFEGQSLAVTGDLFVNDALILQDPRSRSVTLKSQRGFDRVRVDWFDAPVLGLWAKPGAPYVCVEPWYGIDEDAAVTGNLQDKPRIQKLGPGQSFCFPIHITAL